MDPLLVIIAILLALIGFVGAVMPGIPGPPLNYGALVVLYFAIPGEIGIAALIIFGVLTLLMTLLDYVAPAFMTKLGGGSKRAALGATLGLFGSLIFLPAFVVLGPISLPGIIVFPFLGAFLFELTASQNVNKAFSVAMFSFLGFLLTTGGKLLLGFIISGYMLIAVLHHAIA